MLFPPDVQWFLCHSLASVVIGALIGVWLGRRRSAGGAFQLLTWLVAGVVAFVALRLTGLEDVGGAFRRALVFWSMGITAYLVTRSRGQSPKVRM